MSLVKCLTCRNSGLFEENKAIHKYYHKYCKVIPITQHIQNELSEFLREQT